MYTSRCLNFSRPVSRPPPLRVASRATGALADKMHAIALLLLPVCGASTTRYDGTVTCTSGLANDQRFASCDPFCSKKSHCRMCRCKTCTMCTAGPPPPPTRKSLQQRHSSASDVVRTTSEATKSSSPSGKRKHGSGTDASGKQGLPVSGSMEEVPSLPSSKRSHFRASESMGKSPVTDAVCKRPLCVSHCDKSKRTSQCERDCKCRGCDWCAPWRCEAPMCESWCDAKCACHHYSRLNRHAYHVRSSTNCQSDSRHRSQGRTLHQMQMPRVQHVRGAAATATATTPSCAASLAPSAPHAVVAATAATTACSQAVHDSTARPRQARRHAIRPLQQAPPTATAAATTASPTPSATAGTHVSFDARR